MLWYIETFPIWVTHLILGIGIAGFVIGSVAHHMPTLEIYAVQLKVFGAFVILVGLMLEGAESLQKDYDVKRAELQHKLDIADAKSHEVVTQVVTQIVYKDRIIEKQSAASVQYIDRWHDAIDSTCQLSKEAIAGLNSNVDSPVLEEKK